FNSSARDHKFVGTIAFKVVVDPKATNSGNVIIYAALSGTNGGIWRSLDSGNHWQLVLAGNATDVLLAPNSADTSGNLQIVYAGIQGQGVFLSPNQGATWSLMAGGQGNPLIQNGNLISGAGHPPVPVNGSGTPNGAKGRIALVTPFLTGQP